MKNTYRLTVGQSTLDLEVTEIGTLRTDWEFKSGGFEVGPQKTLDLIAWLTAHQNYFALAKTHEDQRRALLADIADVAGETKD